MGDPAQGAIHVDHTGRVVALDGTHNVRDLGGLPTVDGRRTVPGRLFRSEFLAAPQTLTDPATRALGLRTVVDLRRFGEVTHEQVAWGEHRVRLHHVPLRLDQGTTWHAGYHRYLLDGPERVIEVVRVLMDPANHPALFHCAAGKDRTGTIAALLLASLGVERDAILQDYAWTVHGLPRVLDRLTDEAPYRDQLQGSNLADHVPRPETMAGFLTWLDETWGGAVPWLVAHGMTQAELAAYESVMLLG